MINGIPLDATASISGSDFADNQAIGGAGQGFEGGSSDGGAIVVGGASPTSAPAMTISQTTITGNVASGGADLATGAGGFAVGARHLQQHHPHGLEQYDQRQPGHRRRRGAGGTYNDGASASGAGLYNASGDVTLTNSQIINNQAIGGAGGDGASGTDGAPGGDAEGGGITSFGTVTYSYDYTTGTYTSTILVATLNATNLTLAGNQAIGGAGGSGGTVPALAPSPARRSETTADPGRSPYRASSAQGRLSGLPQSGNAAYALSASSCR